jgi:hypothetical protein
LNQHPTCPEARAAGRVGFPTRNRIQMAIGIAELAAGAAAVWRVTHLFHAEDGPWDLLARLRRLAGESVWGKMLDCFYCLSVWMALLFAAALGATRMERLVLWPALSGAAILLERATARSTRSAPVANWHEESGGGDEE